MGEEFFKIKSEQKEKDLLDGFAIFSRIQAEQVLRGVNNGMTLESAVERIKAKIELIMKETGKGDDALNALVKQQAKDGSFTGSSHSITYSQGQSLTIETTSIAIMALIKENKNAGKRKGKTYKFMKSGIFFSYNKMIQRSDACKHKDVPT